jgi:hypothetical protein
MSGALDSRKEPRIADIAQMPDLVRRTQPPRKVRGSVVVRVGENGDAHAGTKSESRAVGKDGLQHRVDAS